MEYVIIDQEDMSLVNPVKCGDIPAVAREVLTKVKAGRNPRIFQEIPYDVGVKIREVKDDGVKKSKTKSDKDPGAASDREVRPGDEGSTETEREASGDNSADNSTES